MLVYVMQHTSIQEASILGGCRGSVDASIHNAAY
jgi:hypothetical protein